MSRLAERVISRLLADSTIAGLVAGRAYPYDIRIAGPNAHTEVYDTFGVVKGPTLVVIDQGSRKPLSDVQGAYDGRIAVWGFVNGIDTGRQELDTLMARATAVLLGWQDTETRSLLTFGERRGPVDDPPPDTGVLDRITFRVAGIHAGITG